MINEFIFLIEMNRTDFKLHWILDVWLFKATIRGLTSLCENRDRVDPRLNPSFDPSSQKQFYAKTEIESEIDSISD
jgi:hypothetical protein